MEGTGSATIIVHPKYPEEGGNHSRYYMEGSGSATIIAHPKYPEEGETIQDNIIWKAQGVPQ